MIWLCQPNLLCRESVGLRHECIFGEIGIFGLLHQLYDLFDTIKGLHI